MLFAGLKVGMKKSLVISILLFVFSVCAYSQDPLPAQDVFHFSSKILDPNTILLHWEVKPGYFLYRSRIKATTQNDLIQLGTIRMPKGILKQDKLNGQYEIYRQSVGIPLPVLGLKSGSAQLLVQFQGCADSGFCYPPMAKLLTLTIDKHLAITKLKIADANAPQPGPIATEQHLTKSDTESISDILSNHSLLLVVFSFLGFGLLLSFTPCVLPMVPVLSGIIIGHGKDITTKKAFLLSLTYVLSMSATYALVGVIVAGLGANLQVALQNPWAIGTFALLFVLLALSMFGFYELRLPLRLQQKLSGISQHQKSGAYVGVAVMGFLSTLILSPCITAPLVGALSYIANSGDMLQGGVALFALGIGMGIPLLLIGTSAGKLLPKTGRWMNQVKAFFGVLLLAVAIYLLSRILPGPINLLLWAALLIFSASFMSVWRHQEQPIQHPFAKGASIIMLVYGILLIIGASMGGSDPLEPLSPLNAYVKNQSSNRTNTNAISFTRVKSVADVNAALKQAKAKKRPVLLDFYADWCISCKWMERTVLSDPDVLSMFKGMILLKADVTQNDKQDRQLLSHFGVIAPPTYLLFNINGDEVKAARIIGETDREKFLTKLKQISQ